MIEIKTYTSNKEGSGLDDIFKSKQNSQFCFFNKNGESITVSITYHRQYQLSVRKTITSEGKKNGEVLLSERVGSKFLARQKLVEVMKEEGFKEKGDLKIVENLESFDDFVDFFGDETQAQEEFKKKYNEYFEKVQESSPLYFLRIPSEYLDDQMIEYIFLEKDIEYYDFKTKVLDYFRTQKKKVGEKGKQAIVKYLKYFKVTKGISYTMNIFRDFHKDLPFERITRIDVDDWKKFEKESIIEYYEDKKKITDPDRIRLVRGSKEEIEETKQNALSTLEKEWNIVAKEYGV